MLRLIGIVSIASAMVLYGVAPVFADPSSDQTSSDAAVVTDDQVAPGVAQAFFTQPDGTVVMGVQNSDGSWSSPTQETADLATAAAIASTAPSTTPSSAVLGEIVHNSPSSVDSSNNLATINTPASVDTSENLDTIETPGPTYFTQPDGSVVLGTLNPDGSWSAPANDVSAQ